MENVTMNAQMANSQFNEDGSVWIIFNNQTLKFGNVSTAVNYCRDNNMAVKF